MPDTLIKIKLCLNISLVNKLYRKRSALFYIFFRKMLINFVKAYKCVIFISVMSNTFSFDIKYFGCAQNKQQKFISTLFALLYYYIIILLLYCYTLIIVFLKYMCEYISKIT